MAEKSVAIRLGIVGGQEVTAQFDQIGSRGAANLNKISTAADEAGRSMERSSRAIRGSVQNVGYQVQDFAVQVAGGTSATRALAQQLPQLLSGFGLWGVLLGTAAAIIVPLVASMWNMNAASEANAKSIQNLNTSLDALDKANHVFTPKGIDEAIEKYGQLDAQVMKLLQDQQQFAQSKALADAQTSTEAVSNSFSRLRDLVKQVHDIDVAAPMRGAALSAADLKVATEQIKGEFGLSLDQAQQLDALLASMAKGGSVAEMTAQTQQLVDLLEQSKLKGSDLAKTVLDNLDALIRLNAEGNKTHTWLGTAIDLAGGLAGKLWDAARGAAAVRAGLAQKSGPAAALAGQYALYGGAQTTTRDAMRGDSALFGGNGDGLTKDQADAIAGVKKGGGGGGASAATKAQTQLENDAKAIYDATRTSAEQYALEVEKLNKVKEAGLVDGETYNRQMDALNLKYNQQVSVLETVTKALQDYAKEAADSGKAIGAGIAAGFDAASQLVGDFVKTGKADIRGFVADTLAQFAQIAAKKYLLGPLADGLSSALGGAASGGFDLTALFAGVAHSGGMAGAGAGRMVDPMSFLGARRYHTGGMVGDEVPAILLKRERVLNREETKAYNAGMARGGGSPTVVFNVKDAESVRKSRTQMAADASRIMNTARRAN